MVRPFVGDKKKTVKRRSGCSYTDAVKGRKIETLSLVFLLQGILNDFLMKQQKGKTLLRRELLLLKLIAFSFFKKKI